jgi:DNA-binding NarL/FixJ family response regulator
MRNLAIIEDSELWQNLLITSVRNHGYFNIAYRTMFGSSFLANFNSLKIDFVLLDIALPINNGFEVAKELYNLNPKLPIVMLTTSSMPTDISKLQYPNIKAYLNKIRIHKIGDDLQKIFHLGDYKYKDVYRHVPLTSAERDLLEAICRSQTNYEISQLFHLSEKAIEFQLSKLAAKLHIPNSKAKLNTFAISHGYWPIM